MNQPNPDGEHHTRRDAETLIALGLFMAVLALPVLLGTIWAGPPFDKFINFLCGSALLGIGLAFIFRGRTVLKRLP